MEEKTAVMWEKTFENDVSLVPVSKLNIFKKGITLFFYFNLSKADFYNFKEYTRNTDGRSKHFRPYPFTLQDEKNKA